MKRNDLIKEYIPGYNGLKTKTKKKLLEDLSIFNTSILEALVKQIKKGKKCYVIILPANKKFTDIPEFKNLKGKPFYVPGYGTHVYYKTFDEVRGWGGNPCVIDERYVLRKDKNIFNVPRHEIAHQIHGSILNKGVCKKIYTAYKNAKKNKMFIRKNSAINVGEYFADGITFYFNTFPSKKINVFDMKQICNRKHLFKRDKPLFNLVKDIFVNKKYSFKK